MSDLIEIEVQLELIREALHLPDDVELVSIRSETGGHTAKLVLDTPTGHIKGIRRCSAVMHNRSGTVEFQHFE